MTLKSGTYEIGPSQGELLVKTKRAGAASMMGHDLTLVVGTWNATVTADPDQPGQSSVRATADAGSLTVREGSGGATPLSTKQHGEIHSNIRQKVLKTDKNSQITFESTSITGDASHATVTGNLTLNGTTKPVTLEVAVEEGAGGARVTGGTRFLQSDFGIKPFSALLGALKVKDEVEIAVTVNLPAG